MCDYEGSYLGKAEQTEIAMARTKAVTNVHLHQNINHFHAADVLQLETRGFLYQGLGRL